MTTKAHSDIGASSMYRWSACPASVRLSKDIPRKESSYASAGTKYHDVASRLLTRQEVDQALDPEEFDSVLVYVDYVKDLIEQSEREGGCHGIETRFNLSEIYPGLFGTADAWVYLPKEEKLVVVDYKHGAGIAVYPKENTQLLYYGLGALLTLKKKVTNVDLVIVQPRCHSDDGPIRIWETDYNRLARFSDDLFWFALATENEDAPLVSGDHCRFCPAAGVCPELEAKALAIVQTEFKPISYDASKLAKTLEWLDVLDGWIKNVREFAYEEARNGRTPPGWKLVQKRATRRWKQDDDRTAEALECLLPDQESYWERKLKSPAQVEKLLAKNEKHLLLDLVMSESSGTVLVPESDKRESIPAPPKIEFEVIES